MSKYEKDNVIPDIVHDANSGKSYIKGRFFGKVSLHGYSRFLRPPCIPPLILSNTFFTTNNEIRFNRQTRISSATQIMASTESTKRIDQTFSL